MIKRNLRLMLIACLHVVSLSSQQASSNPQRFFLNIAPIIPDGQRAQYVTPGQVRYASKNAAMKVNEAKKKGIKPRAEGGALPYNNGTSILPLDKALPVIKSPWGHVLVDGHHDSVASLAMGATTIPVYVVDDLSGQLGEYPINSLVEPTVLDPVFWEVAQSRGYVYPYDLQGNWKIPSNFKDLQDDPNRYFAAIAARKCSSEGQPTGESTGAQYPIWIKIGKGKPFVEFEISDALKKAGLQYTYEMGDDLDSDAMKKFVEKARQVLNNASITGLITVPTRTHYTEIPHLCEQKPKIQRLTPLRKPVQSKKQ